MMMAPERLTAQGKTLKKKQSSGLGKSDLLKILCEKAGTTLEAAKGPSRLKVDCEPRQHVMWTLRHVYGWTYGEIGKELGGRDHTTVLHGVLRHQEWVDCLQKAMQEAAQ